MHDWLHDRVMNKVMMRRLKVQVKTSQFDSYKLCAWSQLWSANKVFIFITNIETNDWSDIKAKQLYTIYLQRLSPNPVPYISPHSAAKCPHEHITLYIIAASKPKLMGKKYIHLKQKKK